MANENFFDILVAENEGKKYPVQVPAGVADVGDLVIYEDTFGFLHQGKVIDKASMMEGSIAHRCIEQLRDILRGVMVYKVSWGMDLAEKE